MSVLRLGDIVPDFTADSSHGDISLHKWLDGHWAILFSHPADFTPVCTTELSRAQSLAEEFKKRGVKMVALSCDSADSHRAWVEDIKAYGQLPAVDFPIVADPERRVAELYGMIDPDERDSTGMPLTCRAVFVIGPDKRLKLSILCPATTGRNFHEILRAIDSLQLTASKRVATPVDWKKGDACMIVPSVKQEEVAQLFPKGCTVHPVPSGKQYIRTTPMPE